MLKSYLKIALRCLLRHKAYAVINLAGLALGIVACLLISLYVRDELSFDAYHKDADRIFRIAFEVKRKNENPMFATAPGPLAPALKMDFPQVEQAARFAGGPTLVVKYGRDKAFYEHDNYYYVDPELFEVLTIPFSQGDPKAVFAQPQSVVIAADMARKYFGNEPALNKVLHFNEKDWVVSGVFENIPHNSHLPKFQFLTPIQSVEARWFKAWDGLRTHTYVKLKARVDPGEFENQIKRLAHQHAGEKLAAMGETLAFFLQPIKDIHLHSHLIQESGSPGSTTKIALFSAIALLVLLIACLNFINLATARATSRAKEVGIRKIIGATHVQLMKQFLAEYFLLSMVALVIAMATVEILLPWFNALSGKTLHLAPFSDFTLLLALLGVIILVGLVAGSYPAFLLASLRPAMILKGLWRQGSRRASPRRLLVIFQFAASAVLIMASIIIYQQIHFMKSKNLGFEKEQMLVLPIQSWEMMQTMSKNLKTIKKEFLSHHAIVAATATLRTPGRMEHHDNIRLLEESPEKELGMNCLFVDNDFVSTYNITLAAGRAFRQELATEGGKAFMINEAAVKAFGWASPEEAIGKQLAFWNWQGEIIGVTKDFHFSSLHHRIEPLFFLMPPELFPETFTLKLSTNKLDEAVAFVASKWKEMFPDFPFEFFFLDEDFNRQYRADEELGTIVVIFAGLAIFIACLGLFGLVAFITERRTKEIGIRKVLGASATRIVLLFSKEFTKWVLIANVVALPFAWFAMNRWLQNFAYRIDPDWWAFAFAGGLALIIALLALSTQAIKAALANPVDALRYE